MFIHTFCLYMGSMERVIGLLQGQTHISVPFYAKKSVVHNST